MVREWRKFQSLDEATQRSLTVLADATAEVVGRGEVYQAIIKVASEGSEDSFESAREKFDHMDIGDRARIRAQAIETLGEPREEVPAEPEQLDWASQMMRSFPKLSEGLDGNG
ncbi:MAG: hypothetical protein P1U88_12670 [Thalassobaculaceae bacterium]|nr:hypothetical protein [Thalassobaculaceae bacterium]